MIADLIVAPWLRPVAVALALAAAAASGAWLTATAKDAEIADLRSEASETAMNAVLAQHDRLKKSRQRGDQLALDAAVAESRLQTQAEEHAHEIRRLTAGRRCLDGAVVRLLNAPSSGVGNADGRLSAPASQSAGADGAAASDTDVALWAGTCRRAYDTCRGRLDRVRAFVDGTP